MGAAGDGAGFPGCVGLGVEVIKLIMAIYAKKINGKQRAWLKMYEDETTFEPLYQEKIDSGEMTFDEVVKENLNWFEDWSSEAFSRVSSNVPYTSI